MAKPQMNKPQMDNPRMTDPKTSDPMTGEPKAGEPMTGEPKKGGAPYESGTEQVQAWLDATTLHIRFNNPQRHNALSVDFCAGIPPVLVLAGADGRVRVVVVSGAGVEASCPTTTTDSAGTAARRRTQYSWKWTTRRPLGVSESATATWVSTRSSVMGSRRTRPPRTGVSQRRHSASVTCDSV